MFEATRRVGMQVFPLVVRCVGRASVLPRAGRSAIRRSSDAATEASEAGEEEVFNELDVLYRLKRLEGETAQLGKLKDKLNGYGEEFARSRELRADVRTMEVGWRQDLAGTNMRMDKLGSELRVEMAKVGEESRREFRHTFNLGASLMVIYVIYSEAVRKREEAEASRFRALVREHLWSIAPPRGTPAAIPGQDASVPGKVK